MIYSLTPGKLKWIRPPPQATQFFASPPDSFCQPNLIYSYDDGRSERNNIYICIHIHFFNIKQGSVPLKNSSPVVLLLCGGPTVEGIPAVRDSKHMEWSDDERLFPLKLFALCPKAIGFDGGGVRSSVGQNKAGGPSAGRILEYERANQLQ